MANTAYNRAVERLKALKLEMAELETFLRLYEKYSPGEVGLDEGEASVPIAESASSQPVSKEPSRSPSRWVIARKAREIILGKNRPMVRTELVDALAVVGTPIGGGDKSKNMGTIMWRLRDKFVNLQGYGYWPKDRPYPPAGYLPPVEDALEASEA